MQEVTWTHIPEPRSGEANFKGFYSPTRKALDNMGIGGFTNLRNALSEVLKQSETGRVYPIQKFRNEYGVVMCFIEDVFLELEWNYIQRAFLGIADDKKAYTVALADEAQTLIERIEEHGGKYFNR